MCNIKFLLCPRCFLSDLSLAAPWAYSKCPSPSIDFRLSPDNYCGSWDKLHSDEIVFRCRRGMIYTCCKYWFLIFMMPFLFSKDWHWTLFSWTFFQWTLFSCLLRSCSISWIFVFLLCVCSVFWIFLQYFGGCTEFVIDFVSNSPSTSLIISRYSWFFEAFWVRELCILRFNLFLKCFEYFLCTSIRVQHLHFVAHQPFAYFDFLLIDISITYFIKLKSFHFPSNTFCHAERIVSSAI